MPQQQSSPPSLPPTPNRLLQRSSLIVYLLVVLAVLVIINVLANRHDTSWDWTKNHSHSLSAESVKIISGLHQPLHIILFDRSANFAPARQFFDRYQRQSRLVDVQFVDPDRHPQMARQYKIQTYGSIVIFSGGQQQIVTSMTEQDVTNAIVRVLKGAKKVIYFAAGDGERSPDDSGRNGYSALKTALEAENFTVKPLVLAQTPKVPADCAALIVAGPTHPLLLPEVTAISNYINGGGDALFLISPETSGPLVQYLQTSLNVTLTPDVVVDTSGIGRLFGASELMPVVAHYDTHPITANMNGVATLFPFARTVAPGSLSSARAMVSPLVETSPESFATTHFANNQVQVDPATDRHGPLTLGVAGTLPTVSTGLQNAGDSTEARYVVYGSPDIVSNAIIGFQGNRDLFLNTMDWLAGQKQFITIRPKPPSGAPVSITAGHMRGLFYLFLIGLPLVIILAGIGINLKRRAL
ncbi:MAG: GldG family protein [Terriglobales bacterium]